MTQSDLAAEADYPAEFLQRVDQFINLANALAEEIGSGQASAAILFAAGRYNAFNFLAGGGTEQDRPAATEYYVNEYRKAFIGNLDGAVGPLVRGAG
jgi:Protein of unknown function (DUF3144)